MSEQREKREEARSHLMAFAMLWLARWSDLGREALPFGLPADPDVWLAEYRGLLGQSWPVPEPRAPLLSIFSRVRLDGYKKPKESFWPAVPLSLEEPVYPGDRDKVKPHPRLWETFLEEWERLPPAESEHRFEAFTHLLHKWAWAVPCSYGEPGVSLYDELRVLSALVHASGCEQTPAGSFLLVGGDIPGIQKTIYTITSKGAAKGLRGRSFFIQLLGDAVIRRLLHELGLPETNVIYAAGGNFMLLAPTGEASRLVLDEVNRDINRKLLDSHDGEIAFCLASVTLPAGAVGQADFGSVYSRHLKTAVSHQKAQRFAALARDRDGWQTLFEPKGGGGERAHFCAVCQAELTAKELSDPELVLVDVTELEPGEQGTRACYNCAAFRHLAEAIGQPDQALYLHRGEGTGERWQESLHELSGGYWYRFAGRSKGAEQGESMLLLNEPDFITLGAHGFLFLANTTPRVTAEDVAWWNEAYPDQRDQIRQGGIRSFELLARAAERDGVLGRVGVLRMDVDDLGQVMTRGLVHEGQPHRSMAATSALSAALERFFAGYLDTLCREVTETPGMAGLQGHQGEDLLYVIYAGGDDLFVVGSWHLLPLLAHRVRDAFETYAGQNPSLHISAGITIEGARFPLYQAATRAEKALDGGAKQHRIIENGLTRKKNAVHLLGQTLGWEDLADVRAQADAVARLVKRKDVPRGMLQTLQMIYQRFRQDQQEARARGLEEVQLYYGPWRWRQAYHLARFVEGKPDPVKEQVEALQEWTLKQKRIPYLGLVTRWAEYLTRGKEAES